MVNLSYSDQFQNSNCFIRDNQLQLDSISPFSLNRWSVEKALVSVSWVFSGGLEKWTIRLKTERKLMARGKRKNVQSVTLCKILTGFYSRFGLQPMDSRMDV